MANGENPKGYGKNKQQAPVTRMKIAALQRETVREGAGVQGEESTPAQKADRDLALEPLVEVLERKRTVHFHCHRADDIMTAVRLAEEFGFELVLQHATEGYRVADVLAKKKIPVSLTLVDSPGGKAETMGLLEENAAILDKAGVKVAINTDDSITESRFFLRTGAIAVRGGMTEAAALKALTLTPAKMLHLDHRLGSLEKGKDADFVVLVRRAVQRLHAGAGRRTSTARRCSTARQARLDVPGRRLRAARRRSNCPAPFAADEGREVGAGSGRESEQEPGRTRSGRSSSPAASTPATGPPIEHGAVLVEDGKIAAVWQANDVKIPGDAPILTAADVTPGLIDPLCVAGLTGALNIPADQDQDELSDPNQADLRVLDGFNPHEPLLEFLQANGVTIVHAMPGRHERDRRADRHLPHRRRDGRERGA